MEKFALVIIDAKSQTALHALHGKMELVVEVVEKEKDCRQEHAALLDALVKQQANA